MLAVIEAVYPCRAEAPRPDRPFAVLQCWFPAACRAALPPFIVKCPGLIGVLALTGCGVPGYRARRGVGGQLGLGLRRGGCGGSRGSGPGPPFPLLPSCVPLPCSVPPTLVWPSPRPLS